MSDLLTFVGYVKGVEVKDVGQSKVCEVSVKWRAGWGDRSTVFYPRVSFWGRDAERAQQSITDDQKIRIVGIVTGARVYQKNNGEPGAGFDVKGLSFDVLANDRAAGDQFSPGQSQSQNQRPQGGNGNGGGGWGGGQRPQGGNGNGGGGWGGGWNG